MTDTPTPQMTPEQRAELVTHYTRGKWCIWNGGADCPVPLGTRLEIAGGFDDTWTTVAEEGSIFWPNVAAFRINPPTSKLEAERDALAAAQTDLKAADAQIELLLKNHNGLTAEIARLTAALATAREDGMREAMAIAHDHTPEKHSGLPLASHVTGRNIERAIEAAITKRTRDMTAPDKIWHEIVTAKDMDELYGFGISPDDWNAANFEEYTRTSIAQAAVAAAYEAAAQVCDDGNAGAFWGKAIRAIATPDQIAALAATVMVKPLVWEELEQDRGDGTTDLTGDHEAVSCVGVYSIALSFGSDSYYWSVELNADEIGHSFDDLGYAKAAAQADYDARIRSAITITSGTDSAKMHKAAKVLQEVIDFACALNNVAAGQNPEQLDRWSAALSALAAKVDASQAPNPAANGGRCQSDTITLSRAEVDALMGLLRRAKHCIGDNYLHWQGESDVALATLQERMK